ncbi:MAG: hypothetical protein J7J76_06605 [Candidatus Latescibacteria bacterium]|nr:hypothetical protein [Candidatus Latescibacterota bacterium]
MPRDIGKHPVIYGFELEDEPGGRYRLPEEMWKPFTGGIESFLENQNLFKVGYNRALKRWKMAQYTTYIKELTAPIKQVDSWLKVRMCFNIAAAIPH